MSGSGCSALHGVNSNLNNNNNNNNNKDLASKLNWSGDSKVLNICNAMSEISKLECKPVKFQISVFNSFQKSDINAFVVDTLKSG